MPRARGRLTGAALAEFNRLHPRGPDGRFGRGGARARLADKTPKVPPPPLDARTVARGLARQRLSQVSTRKEGRNVLAGLGMADLRKLARKNDVRPGRSRASAIDAIVNATVREDVQPAPTVGRHRARGPAASALAAPPTAQPAIPTPTPRRPRGRAASALNAPATPRRNASPRRASTDAERAFRRDLPTAVWFSATGKPLDASGDPITGPYRQVPEAIDEMADQLESLGSSFGFNVVRRDARNQLGKAMFLLERNRRPDLTARRNDILDQIDAATPEQIVAMFRELANEADRPAGVTAPTPPPAAGFRLEDVPKADQMIGALIPASSMGGNARREYTTKIFEAKLNGDYAGLRVEVTEVEPMADQVNVTATIHDANGAQIGTTTRSFRRTRNKLWVYHAYLQLDRRVQGQGFAEAWNGHLMDWYIESGLDRIEVTANIDVGGYTWARQGFDWAGKSQAIDIKNRLEREMSRNGQNYNAEQVIAVNDIIARISLPFDDDNFPTAYEMSQVGRLPGQGRTDPWPGKQAMLGSFWSGVKPVPRRANS